MGRSIKLTSDQEYLDPNFDANKLTKPQLRSILASHGITDLPPTTARKEVLVELFVEHIQKNSSIIQRAAASVKPSDKGIIFLDEHSQPSPKRSRSPSPAKRGRRGLSKVDSMSETNKSLDVASPIRRRSRGRSRSPSVSMKRLVTPSPRRSKTRVRSESPLTMLQESLPKYADSPKSATLKLHDRLEYIANANQLSKAKSILVESPRKNSPRKTVSFSLRGGSLRRKDTFRTIWIKLQSMLRFFGIGLLAVIIGFYIRLKFLHPLPYCSNEQSANNYLPKGFGVGEFWKAFRELCVPCPIHGKCHNGTLICDEGFVPSPNWVTFGSRCVPDLRKLTLVDDISTKIRNTLAERAGKILCGTSLDDDMGKVLNGAQLANILKADFPSSEWNDSQFDSLYNLALQEIGRNSKLYGIRLTSNPTDNSLLLHSTSPSLTVSCRLKIFFSDFYERNWIRIWVASSLLLALLYLYWSFTRTLKVAKKVEELVQAVLQILAEQDALNRRDPTVASTISIHQIRDALFYKNTNRVKNQLWPLVCKAISRNSNVRESVMSIRGEQHRVWEWIGSDVLSPLILSKNH